MTKRRRRVVALLAIGALILSACGGGDAGTQTDAGGGGQTEDGATGAGAAEGAGGEVDQWLADVREEHEGEEVVLLMASHPATEAFQETIKPFEEATGVDVSFDVLEEGAMIEKNLLECERGGDTYDIWMIAIEGVARMSETGCAAPLDDRVEQTAEFFDYDDILPAYADLMVNEVDGNSVWGIPFAGESVFLMYRQDLFDEAGVEVPQTWEELRDVARQFQEEGEVSGVAFRARRGWEFTYQYSVFLFPFGGRILDPETGEPAIDTQGSVNALEYMTSLKDYAPTGIEGFSFPEAWQSMQTGRVAMLVEATAAAPELEDPSKSQVAGQVGYAPLPEGPEGAFSGVWGWGLGVNGHSQKQDAAWRVIEWLTSRETHPDYVDAGGIPTRTSIVEDPEYQERFPFLEATQAALEQASTLGEQGLATVPKHRQWHLYSEAIGNHGSQAFSGQIDPEEAVRRMSAEMEEIAAAAE